MEGGVGPVTAAEGGGPQPLHQEGQKGSQESQGENQGPEQAMHAERVGGGGGAEPQPASDGQQGVKRRRLPSKEVSDRNWRC